MLSDVDVEIEFAISVQIACPQQVPGRIVATIIKGIKSLRRFTRHKHKPGISGEGAIVTPARVFCGTNHFQKICLVTQF